MTTGEKEHLLCMIRQAEGNISAALAKTGIVTQKVSDGGKAQGKLSAARMALTDIRLQLMRS